MSDVKENVTFCMSTDLHNTPLKIHVDKLIGQKTLLTQSQKFKHPELTRLNSNINSVSELFISLQVCDSSTGRELSIPVTTTYKHFKNTRKWSEWLELPISLSLLNIHCKLIMTIWEYGPEGNQTVFYKIDTNLFDLNSMTLKRGTECIKFALDKPHGTHEIIENRAQQLLDKYILGEITPDPWIDAISIENMKKESTKFDLKPNEFVLFIHFPYYDIPIVADKVQLPTYSNIPTITTFKMNTNDVLVNGSKIKENQNKYQDIKIESINLPNNYNSMKFFDPDQYNSDPVEEKFRRLERSMNNKSRVASTAKPDAGKREVLNKIINYPPGTELTAHEKALIWKYRYYCMSIKRSLTKFLQSATLNDETERIEVMHLMDLWIDIGIEDAIELLGPRYTASFVREFAVKRLEKSTDDEIHLYLLQLVQALCFENLASAAQALLSASDGTSLLRSTESNFKKNKLSKQDLLVSEYSGSIGEADNMDYESQHLIIANNEDANSVESLKHSIASLSPLGQFLISRARENEELGNYFFWYLKSESKDSENLTVVLDIFFNNLSETHKEKLTSQVKFMDMLRDFCVQIKNLRDTTQKKTSLLHHLVTHRLKPFLRNKTVYLPLDPSVIVTDVIPNQCKVFKSSLSPLKITLKTKDEKLYSLMYKVGDDLRQDQLVVQIIKLMDVLLKNENVDLKLTPYKIITTGTDEGALEFIPNETITNILSKYHGIAPFLANYKADLSNGNSSIDSTNIDPMVMDNFIKSCAGYCVITYILGVGDRHLDNLLITPDGRFFHADFGFILGRDPKPFPPLMKLPPQVIEAFGGIDSTNYNKFRSYCFVAYSILRRNSGLILNLFELMKNSQIPDIKLDPQSAVLKVKEKFGLDMSEEEAIVHFQNLINVSVNALMPLVIDHLHNLTQYWRA